MIYGTKVDIKSWSVRPDDVPKKINKRLALDNSTHGIIDLSSIKAMWYKRFMNIKVVCD